MALNVRIEAIEAAEAKVVAFTQEETEFRAQAIASDGIDAEEQAQLDRINSKIAELQQIIATLRDEVERNRSAWEARASEWQTAQTQITEIETFGLPGATEMRARLGDIDQAVSDQRWADASSILVALQRTLAPVHVTYLAQNASKTAYEPLRADFDRRLAAVRADATPGMTRTLTSIDNAIPAMDAKADARDFTAALADLNALIERLQPLEDQNQLADVDEALEGSSTAVDGAAYSVGPPSRPTINHDNGFLQNPDDPNDPTPMPTRDPTMEERLYYASERAQAEGANLLTYVPWAEEADSRLGLDNALAGYQHFLTGNGADFEFDYEAYLEDDPAGQRFKEDVQSDVRHAADEIYEDLGTELPETEGATVTFHMHGGQPSGGPPYPETEDWQKAIGGHNTWTNTEVTLERQADGSIRATARITLEAEDRYNFNPDQADIATGVPDQERGVLEESGLAHQFTQNGSAEFETSWTVGDPGTPAPDAGWFGGR